MFRRDNGRANDRYGHQSYLTLEEADEAARRDAAVLALRALHVDVSFRCTLTVRQLEAMARVASGAGSDRS